MKFKKAIPYTIEIIPTINNGFTVKVGCRILAYSDYAKLIDDLLDYLKDPIGVEATCNKMLSTSAASGDTVTIRSPVFLDQSITEPKEVYSEELAEQVDKDILENEEDSYDAVESFLNTEDKEPPKLDERNE